MEARRKARSPHARRHSARWARQAGRQTVYAIEQLRTIVRPIADRLGMRSVSVFGSYARGEADGDSDIDLVMDHGDQRVTRIFGVGGEVEAATGKCVDAYAWDELLPGPLRDAIVREAVAL